MIAPTHGIFTLVIIFLFGISLKKTLLYLLLGALLPDIDHPQSTIGRIFFFISHPLHKKFGHRNLTHSLILWLPVILFGWYYFIPLFWIGIGAFSHLILDCWNLSGIGLFKPITDKIFVMASKKYRIRVGSKRELILMVCLIFIAWGSFHLSQLGGFRGLVRELIGDYNIAVKEYKKQGTHICYMEGKIRYNNGKLEEGKWLILGQNDYYNSLSLYDKKNHRIIKTPDDITFLRAHLRPTKKRWQTLSLKQPMKILKGTAFYHVSKGWYQAQKDDLVLGDIIYQGELKLGENDID